MDTLMNLFMDIDKCKGVKVRCVDWDFRIRYFLVLKFHNDTKKFYGVLNNGEEYSVHMDTGFWQFYEPGMENTAKAA